MATEIEILREAISELASRATGGHADPNNPGYADKRRIKEFAISVRDAARRARRIGGQVANLGSAVEALAAMVENELLERVGSVLYDGDEYHDFRYAAAGESESVYVGRHPVYVVRPDPPRGQEQVGETAEVVAHLNAAVENLSGNRVRLAEAFIRGFQEGAEFPDDSGDGDAMYQHFRDWRDAEGGVTTYPPAGEQV